MVREVFGMFCAAAAAAALVGCGSMRQPAPPQDIIDAGVSVACFGQEECSRLWRRAQAWVVQNAGMKIQTATDAVIKTFNPPLYSTVWGFQVLRVPGAVTGEELLELRVTCGAAPICREHPASMIASFNRYIRAGKS